MKNKLPVLITTKDRGVFFGYINQDDIDKEDIHAEEIQMCVKWTRDIGGVLGLGAKGPSKTCRISPVVPSGYIRGVRFVGECTPKAVAAWKSEPWGD